jgi:hypothetical protein
LITYLDQGLQAPSYFKKVSLWFFFSHSEFSLDIFCTLRCGVSNRFLSAMTRTPRNAKRAKISVYKPKAKNHRAKASSMVVLTPTTTRRGKIIYTEKDAAPYYAPSDEEEESPKRKSSKTPSHPRTAIPPSLEDIFQWEASCLDDQEPCISRVTKVRLRHDT